MKKKSAGSVAIMLLVMIYLLIPLVISIIYSVFHKWTGLFLKDLPFTTMWTCLWTAISLHLLDDLSQ